jgi:hypothetical protein
MSMTSLAQGRDLAPGYRVRGEATIRIAPVRRATVGPRRRLDLFHALETRCSLSIILTRRVRAQPRRHVLEVRAPACRAIAGTEGPISTSFGVTLDGAGFVWAMVYFTTKARRNVMVVSLADVTIARRFFVPSCLHGRVKRSSYQSPDYNVRTDMIPTGAGSSTARRRYSQR